MPLETDDLWPFSMIALRFAFARSSSRFIAQVVGSDICLRWYEYRGWQEGRKSDKSERQSGTI